MGILLLIFLDKEMGIKTVHYKGILKSLWKDGIMKYAYFVAKKILKSMKICMIYIFQKLLKIMNINVF